jgi:hypothetical protein
LLPTVVLSFPDTPTERVRLEDVLGFVGVLLRPLAFPAAPPLKEDLSWVLAAPPVDLPGVGSLLLLAVGADLLVDALDIAALGMVLGLLAVAAVLVLRALLGPATGLPFATLMAVALSACSCASSFTVSTTLMSSPATSLTLPSPAADTLFDVDVAPSSLSSCP